MAKFVSQFSPELCKLESSNLVYICRMSDFIVGLRLRVMALIFQLDLSLGLRYNQLTRKVTFSTVDVLLSMSYVFATHLPVNKIGK